MASRAPCPGGGVPWPSSASTWALPTRPRPSCAAGARSSSPRVAADPRFERRGADLWRSESVPVHDAVLGTRLVVPTLEGSAEVAVPAGTQPGSVLRLRGKGLPRLGGGRRGDLEVQILVGIPEAPSREERELYERLRGLARAHDRSAS